MFPSSRNLSLCGKGLWAFPLPAEQNQGWGATLPLTGGALVCSQSLAFPFQSKQRCPPDLEEVNFLFSKHGLFVLHCWSTHKISCSLADVLSLASSLKFELQGEVLIWDLFYGNFFLWNDGLRNCTNEVCSGGHTPVAAVRMCCEPLLVAEYSQE